MEEIWRVLYANPAAVQHDNDVLCNWLLPRRHDFEAETEQKVFAEMLLKMDCSRMSEVGFRCFREHFEHVNELKVELTINHAKYVLIPL